ncbi:uncharacterized protein LOC110932523 [Helianthus annuus]|uniref:uncharacterized protein LOC110932523 n=1 Tax=Helianthus annuus TaxID=4232 RepID=UPI001652DAE1|nr:uncharacterized protein LOC110932523 [Helianthus annuus]
MDTTILYDVCKKICGTWDWTSNGSLCNKGTQIILGCNANVVDVMVLSQTNQVIHTQIVFKTDNKVMFCSFVYAENYYKKRRELWENLCFRNKFVYDKPWMILGDFNSSLSMEDNLFGSSKVTTGMKDFKDCVNELEVVDINSSGIHFTWRQKLKKGVGILKKLDRIMGNTCFLDSFPAACALFLPSRISDHTPCILKLPSVRPGKPKPFKFANFLTEKAGFRDVFSNGWKVDVEGVHMYKVVKKLKVMKSPLRKLLQSQGNLHKKVVDTRRELENIQAQIDSDPPNYSLHEREAIIMRNLNVATLDEENFLKQKAKVEWLGVGDSNAAYFHNKVKSKNHRGDAPKALVDYYEKFLGTHGTSTTLPADELFSKKLSARQAKFMVRDVTNEEIKEAMFGIGVNKAPGPDG